MSLERIIQTLVNLGLDRLDAEVYVYVANKGPQSVNDLDNSLNYSKNQISKSLNKLITITLVVKDEHSFSAIPFEEALNLLIQKQKEDQQSFEQLKKELNF